MLEHLGEEQCDAIFGTGSEDAKDVQATVYIPGKLTEKMAEWFKGEVGKVETTEKLTKSPASLTVEDGQMSIHLERLMRNHQQKTAFDSTRILLVNPYHPLIIKLAELVGDKDKEAEVRDAAQLVLEQAKIAEGEAVSNPSLFNEKLSEFILRAI